MAAAAGMMLAPLLAPMLMPPPPPPSPLDILLPMALLGGVAVLVVSMRKSPPYTNAVYPPAMRPVGG
jgi:hypothetical protein